MEKKKYVCSVCGWVYDGPDFESESDEFVCPLCFVGKDLFEEEE